MIADAMLSTAHFLAVFLLIASMAIEFSLLRGPLTTPEGIRRLVMADRGYGMAAVLVIAAGVSRVYFGAKDESYYFQLHSFWTKMGVFVLIGLISIWPTVRILAWGARFESKSNVRAAAGRREGGAPSGCRSGVPDRADRDQRGADGARNRLIRTG